MGKKSHKVQPEVTLEHKVDEVLGELAAANLQLDEITAKQKKSAKQLHALQKKIKKMRVCKCNKKMTKKKSSKKKSKMPLVTSNAGLENSAMSLMALADEPANANDDLQLIAGVGPKLEEMLNSQGIERFEQIASWTADDIEQMDEHLEFSGRIERENWIEQAKALAKGGRDEYVKVFGKEPR
ncbi:MAG: hypothetical protein AAF478_00685 [Pseudomonadota bacterium]